MAPRRTLVVEGWRWLAHSYAIVNQFQLLSLMKRGDVSLRHSDIPVANAKWIETSGLFDAERERALRGIAGPIDNERPDAVLRIGYPIGLPPRTPGVDAPRTAVF